MKMRSNGFILVNQAISMKKSLFPFEIGNSIYREAYVYAVKLTRNLNKEAVLLNTFLIEADNNITEARYS